MATITLTDNSPEVMKATGGGGKETASLSDTNPAIFKASGGGSREHILLYDYPPTLGESRARAGFNLLFKEMLDY